MRHTEILSPNFNPYGLDPNSFFSAYGLAEFTLAVSNYGRKVRSFYADRISQDKAVVAPVSAKGTQIRSLVSCGKPLVGAPPLPRIKIVDTKEGVQRTSRRCDW